MLLVPGFAELEALRFGADPGAEVDLGCFVNQVHAHPTLLVDGEGEVGGERSEEVAKCRVKVRSELVGNEIVGHGPDQHHGPCKRGISRE